MKHSRVLPICCGQQQQDSGRIEQKCHHQDEVARPNWRSGQRARSDGPPVELRPREAGSINHEYPCGLIRPGRTRYGLPGLSYQTGWMGDGRSAAARYVPVRGGFLAGHVMAKLPTTTPRPVRRLFRARFPNGTSIQRVYIDRVFTHAYLILYERPDAKVGFQRGFCSSLDEAEAKVEEEIPWLSRNSYTLIEAFIVDADDITDKIKK